MGFVFFFFNDTATTEIYTLSLHDALPIYNWFPARKSKAIFPLFPQSKERGRGPWGGRERASVTKTDRKSTRLNSSHSQISYAVFCLKKKNKQRSRASRRCRSQTFPAIRLN